MFDTLVTFLLVFSKPLIVTTIGALIYTSIILSIGRISARQAFTLFVTGIIVITCIFMPFNWSIQNSGSGKELSLFFFQVNIEGNNFIQILQDALSKYDFTKGNTSYIITFFLAFLEEFSKLTLLILCMRKSLRLPIVIAYIILVYSQIHPIIANVDTPRVQLISISVLAFIGLIMVWNLLGTAIRTESVSDYIYSIALVAAGFAFAENIKYMIEISESTGSMDAVMNNAVLRSIFGYLSHIFFSMVCVALYARGRFAFLRMIDNTGELSLTQRALGWKNFTKLKTIQGYWLGIICWSTLHGFYNIMISTPLVTLWQLQISGIVISASMLVLGFLFLEFFVLHDLRNNTKYGSLEKYMQ